MYRDFIGERHDSQVTATKFFNLSPKSMSILFLDFGANRRFDYANAHLLREIRSFAEHFVLEIRCELISRHAFKVAICGLK